MASLMINQGEVLTNSSYLIELVESLTTLVRYTLMKLCLECIIRERREEYYMIVERGWSR